MGAWISFDIEIGTFLKPQFHIPVSHTCFTNLFHKPVSHTCVTYLCHIPVSHTCFTYLFHIPVSHNLSQIPFFTYLSHTRRRLLPVLQRLAQQFGDYLNSTSIYTLKI